MATYLERYQAGEQEQVWAELVALGEAAVKEPLLADTEAVARETMRRARHNIELIIARLEANGFQFGSTPNEPGYWAKTPPLVAWDSSGVSALAKLEAEAGSIPLSLRIFFEAIGSVNLVGLFPGWPHEVLPDPLMIDAVDDKWLQFHLDNYRDWDDWGGEEGLDVPYLLELAPDIYHKSNISGGLSYGVHLPARAADAGFENDGHETTFVDYLRLCFQWGGFPGLEQYGEEEWRIARLEDLKAGLLPI